MVDEAELRDPVHPVFEASLVWRVVGHRRGEESGPFRWPVPPAAAAAVGSASHPFAEQTVSRGLRKLQWVTLADPETVTRIFFLVQVWLWEVLCNFVLVQPLSWSSLVVFSPHIPFQLRNGSLLWRIREDDTSK